MVRRGRTRPMILLLDARDIIPGNVVLGNPFDSGIIGDVILRKVVGTVTVFFVNL